MPPFCFKYTPGYLPLDIACSSRLTVFLEVCKWTNISANVFSRQLEVTFYFLCTLGITLGEDLSPEKKLHKRLFNDSYYSVDLLPLNSLSSTINVSFGFELIKIVNVVSEYKLLLFINYTTMKGHERCCVMLLTLV